jgi:hypothetical protein
MLRLPASQREDAQAARVQVDLGPHQPVRPRGRDREAPAQHHHRPPLVAASQEDDPAARSGLQVQRPVRGEGTTRWGRLDPRGGTSADGGHELARLGLHALHRLVDEAGPDLERQTVGWRTV